MLLAVSGLGHRDLVEALRLNERNGDEGVHGDVLAG